jgi:hypothetical protein
MDPLLGLVGIFGGVALATVGPRLCRWLSLRLRPGDHQPRRQPLWVMTLAWASMLVGLGSIVATAVATVWHTWAHLRGAGERLVTGWPADAIFAGFGPNAWTTFQWVILALTWLGGVAVNWFARRFLLQYVGDVAIYISAHKLSRFAEARNAIQRSAHEVVDAVYRAGGVGSFDYPGVVVMGHSLGSVIAYDALNAMLVRDALDEAPLDVAGRTRMFLTFGSPLDKTAFIFRAHGRSRSGAREALAAAKQPMILSYDSRPASWLNIHSPNDWISGDLQYYDDKDQTDRKAQWVENASDPEASTPLAAHNEYWGGRLLSDRLYRVVTS